MGSIVPQIGLHARTDAMQESANVQLNISPVTSDRMGGPLHSHPGMSCVIVALRPPSVGYCRIKSADPRVHPSILHNFLATSEAQQVAVDALKLARKITAGSALAPFTPAEMLPGPDMRTDAELLSYARATVSMIFHQSGTCKMGPVNDGMAVVDESCA
jgi:choline dehydrogenase